MRKRGRKREEEEAGKKKDKEDGEADRNALCFRERGQPAALGSKITNWTSGVDLLAFFYKLLVSVYTVKAF